MTRLRHLLLRYRFVPAALVLAALAMRLLVPAGFMPIWSNAGLVITLCPGKTAAATQHHAMPGMSHHAEPQPQDHGDGREQPCAYAGLAMPSLAGADPILLTLALLFVLAIVRHLDRAPVVRQNHWRPPLRGPPIPA